MDIYADQGLLELFHLYDEVQLNQEERCSAHSNLSRPLQ